MERERERHMMLSTKSFTSEHKTQEAELLMVLQLKIFSTPKQSEAALSLTAEV